MSKPVFKFVPNKRKNNTQIAVHAGPAGKVPKYVGTLTLEDHEAAAALLSALRTTKAPDVELQIAS